MSLDNGDNIISVLVEKCKFIERFSEAFKTETDRTVGYLGHLVHLANELIKASTYHEPLAKLLEGTSPFVWSRANYTSSAHKWAIFRK